VLGILFGLDPAPAGSCRVLELGCGDGANLLSMAQTLPASSFLGIDASASAIERGTGLARAAGLTNVELRVASLEALPDALGEVDYIVSHGVYSWVSPRARGALLECAAQRLRADGIAYVSYNAYPGCHLRDMTREILRYHLRDVDDPDTQLEQAHRLMETIVAIDDPNPYARALREQMERMLQFSDALLFHDDLAEISTPFYFHEFVGHAAAHGLQFLSEADLAESRMEGVPASAEQLFATVTDDPLAREQYMDFFKNRTFRRTLLCRAQRTVRRAIEDVHLERFTISSSARFQPPQDGGSAAQTFATPEGYSVMTSEPLVVAALRALADRWPAGLAFGELLERSAGAAGAPRVVAAGRLRAFLLEAYAARVVHLQSVASPISPRPGERPQASALGRAQAAAGRSAVSSLLHVNAHLHGELEPALLPLLDGTRDRRALSEHLIEDAAGTSRSSPDPGEIDAALERFASLGLLHA
jgi:SAM-dependent methyltransferase